MSSYLKRSSCKQSLQGRKTLTSYNKLKRQLWAPLWELFNFNATYCSKLVIIPRANVPHYSSHIPSLTMSTRAFAFVSCFDADVTVPTNFAPRLLHNCAQDGRYYQALSVIEFCSQLIAVLGRFLPSWLIAANSHFIARCAWNMRALVRDNSERSTALRRRQIPPDAD